MNYFDKFDAMDAKLENTLADKYLLHKFSADSYPMSLTITQNQTPDAQMALYEQDEDGVSSQDAKLVLTFPVGEIGMRIYGRLIIPDALLSKIKNCGKKMRDLYLQADYASRMERAGRSQVSDKDCKYERDDSDVDEPFTEESDGAGV